MEKRIAKLEKELRLQSYLIWILLAVVIVDTAALLILWGERGKPDFDHIAVSLTVFQTMFAIAALYGFWALRGLTIEKAQEVTEIEVQNIAPPLIRREVDEFKRTFDREAPISASDIDKMVTAAGDDGKEEGNGKK